MQAEREERTRRVKNTIVKKIMGSKGENGISFYEVAKQLARSIKDQLPTVTAKVDQPNINSKDEDTIIFKLKTNDSEEDDVVVPRKKGSTNEAEKEVSWVPKVQFFKSESSDSASNLGQKLDKKLKEATAWKTEKLLQDGLFVPPRDPKKINKQARKQMKDTLGSKWFEMPAQTLTPELKKDLQLLKMRDVIDPKRHYKADDSKSIPKYFQIGTVIEPSTEFYSRLTRKERKPTIADELLSDRDFNQYRKRKHLEIEKQYNPPRKSRYKKKRHHQKNHN